MRVVVQADPIDATREYAVVRDRLGGQAGAIVTFSGLMREMGEDGALANMTLEHYPAMTRQELERIAREAQGRWELDEVVVVHRFGTLKPGDEIVVVVTAARHRREAFEAAWFLMDYLKTRAPFWKKETTATGRQRWVDARTTDASAAARWGKTGTRDRPTSANPAGSRRRRGD
ncbi:MAG: molybdenum cofactor biosynthesis protein MoaE [Alphaproteobacteria bacterium]|nr:MAG: molybdenum cofactor biosynthesis protein MoaE [Alphaproteobacteria bacterium]